MDAKNNPQQQGLEAAGRWTYVLNTNRNMAGFFAKMCGTAFARFQPVFLSLAARVKDWRFLVRNDQFLARVAARRVRKFAPTERDV
jgi:hypothetical protein